MKLFKNLLVASLVFAGFFLIKAYQPSMQVSYPDQCSFTIDEQFSKSHQQRIKDFVKETP